MFRLLLSLALVCLVAGIQNGEEALFTSCAVKFYGTSYDKFFVHHDGTTLTLCFDQLYDGSAHGDCVAFEGVGSEEFDFSVLQSDANSAVWSSVETALTTAKSKLGSEIPEETPTCAPSLSYNSAEYIFLVPYGNLLLLLTKDLVVAGESDSVKIYVDDFVALTSQTHNTDVNSWLEGCRQEGAKPLSLLSGPETIPDTCEIKECTASGITTTTTCGSNTRCVQGQCVEWIKHTCVMLPATIIDNGGTARSIDNFCQRTLLSNSYFTLSSGFLTRRLTDVPFLEQMFFTASDGILTLTNDGKVHKPDSSVVTISENGAQIDDFLFTKVSGGVTIKFTKTDLITEVFFDGTIARIVYEGVKEKVSGTDMCTKDSVVPPSTKPDGCDSVADDSHADGIDCDAVKEKCNALLEDPFKSCSVDSTPYITACSNLLCNYPDKDGLFCLLLDAYARSCDIQDQAWKEAMGCSAFECVDKPCLFENEFCGLSLGRRAKCFCRAVYAAPYVSQGKLGDDTVCSSQTASVSLLGCLLEEKNIDITTLHLNDDTCTGDIDPKTNKITFSFDSSNTCKAKVMVNGTNIVYSNTILSAGNEGVISRDDQLSIEFSCKYAQPQVQTMSLKIMESSVVRVIDAGEWTYVFVMSAFTDEARTAGLDPATAVILNQPLWIQAKATEVDEQLMALVIEGCWATKENNAEATDKYFLIKDGCSYEESVTVISNGAGLESVFSFKVFQFVGSDTDVYLHCDIKLCLKSDGCTKTCSQG
ncbi:hypothetical protein WMY93_015144 [Mugilogobius chulae]|uniref:ZP domain-containing protein n=1 Tax=Mugilogobius chulae TaxID=88201 RepID=A0AAW0P8P3_9GOBI